MEYALLCLFLTGGYVFAALLFWAAWKKRKPVRITLALIAGGVIGAQTLVWHWLIRFGEAWNGKSEGRWVVWGIPIAVYCVLTAGLLVQDGDPLPPSKPSPKKPAPEEEYGPLR